MPSFGLVVGPGTLETTVGQGIVLAGRRIAVEEHEDRLRQGRCRDREQHLGLGSGEDGVIHDPTFLQTVHHVDRSTLIDRIQIERRALQGQLTVRIHRDIGQYDIP